MSFTSIDQRILSLIDILKQLDLIRFNQEFCDEIGLLKQNLVNIRKGSAHFTTEHIENIVTTFKVNANWIFGVSDVIFIDQLSKASNKVKP